MKKILNIRVCIFLCCVCLVSIVQAEQCTWIDDPGAKNVFSEIHKIGESLQDWDTNCKANNPTREYMKNCWCDVNKESLSKLKAKLEEARKQYPIFFGKKVCFKIDKLTSLNLFVSSYDKFVKRCE